MDHRYRYRDNADGEWTLIDRVAGYRLCTFHGGAHGGAHVHRYPDMAIVGSVALDDADEAAACMEAYGAGHDEFDLAEFQEVIRRFRSGLKNG